MARAAANVLRLEADRVGFRDLQHEYLLLKAPTLAVLHAELLEAYRAVLPAGDRDQWGRLPADEPYIWEGTVASADHPRPGATRKTQVKMLHRVSEPHTMSLASGRAQR